MSKLIYIHIYICSISLGLVCLYIFLWFKETHIHTHLNTYTQRQPIKISTTKTLNVIKRNIDYPTRRHLTFYINLPKWWWCKEKCIKIKSTHKRNKEKKFNAKKKKNYRRIKNNSTVQHLLTTTCNKKHLLIVNSGLHYKPWSFQRFKL